MTDDVVGGDGLCGEELRCCGNCRGGCDYRPLDAEVSHIRVGFSTKFGSFLSWATRKVQRWMHSHIVLVSPDGRWVIESTDQEWSDADGTLRNGVRVMPLAYLLERNNVEVRAIQLPEGVTPEAVWQAALAYLDRRYDNRFSFGAFFGTDDEDEDKLSCTELVRFACRDAGFDPLPSQVRIPWVRDFYTISKPL